MVQLRPAVRAVGKPGKHTHFSQLCRAAALLPILLYKFPCLLINDGFVGVLKPCIDKRDAAQKRRDKVEQYAGNSKITANKRRKKFDFSKQPPVSKILRTKDAKSAIYGRSKVAIRHSPRAAGRVRKLWEFAFFRHCYICFVCLRFLSGIGDSFINAFRVYLPCNQRKGE